MASVILAGVLAGSGVYYISRIAPRIGKRVAMARGGSALANSANQPYHKFEYGFQPSMNEREALLLLGFPESTATAVFKRPSEDAVRTRYRSLIKELHSDVKGTPYIATKLNQAKDILIK